MRRCKRVCVVGGGVSGLASIRELLDEGIEPVCYEKSDKFGGTWCYRDEPVEGLPSTMSTTAINHSKEMGSLSNLPYPDDFPNYPRHWELYAHVSQMAEKHGLMKYLTCNREVVEVVRADDYDDSGRWVVSVRNTESGEVTSDIFDGVMVCTGHITYPKMPYYPGMETFRGKLMHSHDLKTFEIFKNKRVAVLGIGCSALDAATAISNVAKQVYLSMRSPSWIVSRVGPFGFPIDYVIMRRYMMFVQEVLSVKFASLLAQKLFLDPKFNHRLYGIEPKFPFLCKDPSVNDDIPARLLTGAVVLCRDVKTFKENGVVFEEDDEQLTELDAVVVATGYTWKFPFLEKGIIDVDGDRINLYKCMYPPDLRYPTLAIIGLLLPFGPGFPLGEIQCRWAAHLFSGKSSLPSRDVMMADIDRRYEENIKRYSPSEKMSIRVDFIQYMDEIASQFGVKPNFLKMLFTDPALFKACIFGPCLPYQYRLVGPHKWDGAREAIFTASKRMRAPFNKHLKNQKKDSHKSPVFAYVVSFLVMALLISFKYFSLKYFILALLIPYFCSIRSFERKYLFAMLLLPFYVPWDGFCVDYFMTLFLPVAIAAILSFL